MNKPELEKECKRQQEITRFLESKIYNFRKFIDKHLEYFREGLADENDPRNENAFKILVKLANIFNNEITPHTMRCGQPIDIPVRNFRVNFMEELADE